MLKINRSYSIFIGIFCQSQGSTDQVKLNFPELRKRSRGTFYTEVSTISLLCIIIPSLTVRKRKNRCIPCVYWAAAIFTVVSNYSNLFLPFAFFLDCSHFTFGYELVVCPEPTGLMKIICDLFPLIQRDKSLLLYPGEIHSF